MKPTIEHIFSSQTPLFNNGAIVMGTTGTTGTPFGGYIYIS